jgi:Arc/MetJ-type ribon-helix-helix transcriptional regulator
MQYNPEMETASFRLPPAVVRALERVAARKRVPKSALVREALQRYLALEKSSRSTGALVDALLTYAGSHAGDLAARGEEILRKRFRARRRSR